MLKTKQLLISALRVICERTSRGTALNMANSLWLRHTDARTADMPHFKRETVHFANHSFAPSEG